MKHTTENGHVRYFTLSLQPARGLIHPVDDALAVASGLTRESLNHLSIRDEAGTLYYRLRGDSTLLDEVFTDRSEVIQYDTIGETAGVFDCYLRVRVEESTGILDECFGQGLLIDPPVTFPDHDELRVTVIGTSAMAQRAMECLPSEISCSVERLGDGADDRLLLSTLTGRQREVIETAFGLGYYEIPRRATHEDIAAALELSGSTVDEHLRKAESTLMEQLLS